MIIDLKNFIASEGRFWTELDQHLNRLEEGQPTSQSFAELQRFHYLYERASADLAKLATYSAEPESRRYLENLVARAYGEIHETRRKAHRLAPLTWFLHTLPRTFRRHIRAFCLAALITAAGALFGSAALIFDSEAKTAIVPPQFAHLLGDPAQRVAREEQRPFEPGPERLTTFSAELMTNNIRVSLTALAFGMLYGIGTILILFYNGILLGVVVADYLLAGQALFLAGWLLPHGSIEIPAILMGGQAGFVLAGALLGRRQRQPLHERLRAISKDLVTLIGGLALLLVWAGLVEAFFSQFHAPLLPYPVKIAFGLLQLTVLAIFLAKSGRTEAGPEEVVPR